MVHNEVACLPIATILLAILQVRLYFGSSAMFPKTKTDLAKIAEVLGLRFTMTAWRSLHNDIP